MSRIETYCASSAMLSNDISIFFGFALWGLLLCCLWLQVLGAVRHPQVRDARRCVANGKPQLDLQVPCRALDLRLPAHSLHPELEADSPRSVECAEHTDFIWCVALKVHDVDEQSSHVSHKSGVSLNITDVSQVPLSTSLTASYRLKILTTDIRHDGLDDNLMLTTGTFL